MSTVMDLLLDMEPTKTETKKMKVKRLSQLCKEDVTVTLAGLTYEKVLQIKQEPQDLGVAILLEGVTEPDLRNRALMEKYKAATPDELVKKLFLPGEIEDIAREIEKLSGYRKEVLEEFQKNC